MNTVNKQMINGCYPVTVNHKEHGRVKCRRHTYCSNGPNTGSNPGRGRIGKKIRTSLMDINESFLCYNVKLKK